MRCSIVSDSLLAQGHGWRSRSISRCSTTGRGVTRRWAMRCLPGRWSRSSIAPRRNHRQPTGLLEEIVFSCRNNLTQSIAGTLLANDMGGYHLSMEMAQSEEAGLLAGAILAAMLGCTIVFTIPVGLGIIATEDRSYFRSEEHT